MSVRLVAILVLLCWAGRAVGFAAVTDVLHYQVTPAELPLGTFAPAFLVDHSARKTDVWRLGQPSIITSGPPRGQDCALHFDGIHDGYILGAGHLLTHMPDRLVLETWVRAQQPRTAGVHGVVAAGDEQQGYVIAQTDDRWVVWVGGVGPSVIAPVVAHTWIHLALVIEGKHGDLYADGRHCGTFPATSVVAGSFTIACTRPNTDCFQGDIAEVRLGTFATGDFRPEDLLLHREGHLITLTAPLTTLVPVHTMPPSPGHLDAELTVPEDAPEDLGVGAYASDGHGGWYRSPTTVALTPGRHRLSFDLGPRAGLVCEPERAGWNAYAYRHMVSGGLYFWSASSSRAAIRLIDLEMLSGPPTSPQEQAPGAGPARLFDLQVAGFDPVARVARAQTGEIWSLSVRPDPFPSHPYTAGHFALCAIITTPDGQQLHVNGFYRQPLDLSDEGDRETGLPSAPARFEVRWRPGMPGTYHVRLTASWEGAEALALTLPDVVVAGAPWDDYVRVDAEDPRFFSTGGRLAHQTFCWPIGLNLHSVWDRRTRDTCGTILTPHRLWNSYEAYLKRLSAAGGTAAEIWLCSWGLSLEWNGAWTEFHGLDGYSDENAERLDRVLDLADSLGIRINLVIHNHGQASNATDKEWENNPWNTAIGGPLAEPAALFTDARALADQEDYRRYIIARWADHPSILGWKLWSEQNLTAGGEHLRSWHEHAAARWHALDIYGHGITTHWAGDYHAADREIVKQPGMNYICIDAYHDSARLLAELLWDGMNAPDGMGHAGKPILVTEYGGSPGACPQPELIAEHHTGAWASLVSGYGGSAMLWWFEWVDQRDQWSPYRAVSRFIVGEDLRSPAAQSIILFCDGGDAALWCRAWKRHGRILGYLQDFDWGRVGTQQRVNTNVSVHIGDEIKPGTMTVEWWDAESGDMLSRQSVKHQNGPLDLACPPFARHIAFKLYRDPEPTSAIQATVSH